MAKEKKLRLAKGSPPAAGPKYQEITGRSFKDHDLCAINPLNQQFEPTESDPVRRRYKMGGG